MKKQIKVRILRRRPLNWHYSAERMALNIIDHCPERLSIRTRVSRFESKGISRRMLDILLCAFDRRGVHHVLGDVHFLTYLLPAQRSILTILDLVALEKTTGIRRSLLFFFWYWLPARRCKIITVISSATGEQLAKQLNGINEKIRVVHCALAPGFEFHQKEFNDTQPVVLHIGTTENKNLMAHIEALKGLRVRLLIIGRLSDVQRQALFDAEIDYENRYCLSEEQLRDAYVESDLLLFCSTYEGFGLPIIEAQATGRPVVTSNQWSMPEVAGDGAILCDPGNVQKIRHAVRSVIADSDLRERLIKNGLENCRRFEEERIAHEYYSLYEELAG